MTSPERLDDLVIDIAVDTSAFDSAMSRIGESFTGGMAGAAAALSPMFASAVRAAEQEELRARATRSTPQLTGHLWPSLHSIGLYRQLPEAELAAWRRERMGDWTPDEDLDACRCRSYHQRTGRHVADCPAEVDDSAYARSRFVEAPTAEPGLDAAAFDLDPGRCWKCDAKPGAEELDGACWRCWYKLTGSKRRERT